MISEEEVKAKTIERFWSKIKIAGINECWEWQRALSRENNYGVFLDMKENGKWTNFRVHRYMYEKIHGKIQNGLQVLHSCDNKLCCNPNHLFLGTQRDNMDDKVKKDRQQKGQMVNTCKLDEDKVKEIRIRFKMGEAKRALGREFGVRHGTIRQIVERRSWKHVV